MTFENIWVVRIHYDTLMNTPLLLKTRKYFWSDLVNYFSSDYVSENTNMFMPMGISYTFSLISNDNGNIMLLGSKIVKESLEAIKLRALPWGYTYP